MKVKSKKKQKGGGSYTGDQLYQFKSLTVNKLKNIENRLKQKSEKAKSGESINSIKNTKRVKSLGSEENKQTDEYYKNALADLSELDEKDYTDKTLLLLDHEGHICKDIISDEIIYPKNAIFINNNGQNAYIYPVKQIEVIEQKDINNYVVYDMFNLYKWILKKRTLPHNRNKISNSVIKTIEDIIIPITIAFLIAVNNRKIDEIKLLIQRGVDVNFIHGRMIETPLHVAARNKYADVVKELVASPGIDVNIQDNEGVTPLHYTAMLGDIKSMNELLKAPEIDVNIQDKKGLTALQMAGIQDNLKCIKRLFAVPGIDPSIRI